MSTSLKLQLYNICVVIGLISLFGRHATQAMFISVGDMSIVSSITGNEITQILLTQEAFTCISTVELYGLNYTFNDTLYWNLLINDIVYDNGSIAINDNTSLTIETNNIKIDETGDTNIVMEVWTDNESSNSWKSENDDLFAITGFTTLVPLIFIILFAVLIKNVYVSLYLGIWIGSFIISGLSFRDGFERSLDVYLLESAASIDHQYVILFTVFLSGLVFLIQRSGGTKGFSVLISSRLAKSAQSTQFACYSYGLLLFFDDYANALVVGSTFKSLTDMYSISREKLAFIVDATSAPVASIIPLSSWIGFELQQIQEQLDLIAANNGGEMPDGLTDNAFVFFIATIPTRFYPIFMLIFQIGIMGLTIEFGPMLVAERLVRVDKRKDGGRGSMTCNDGDDDDGYSDNAHNIEPKKDTPPKWWNMAIPIVTLIVLILAVMINTGVEGIEDDPSTSMTLRNIFASSDAWSALLYGTFATSLFSLFVFMIQFKHKGRIVPPSFIACKSYLWKSSSDSDDDDDKESDKEDVAVPLMGFDEIIDYWIKGVAFMAPAVCILILVWAIGSLMTDIGADRYFTRIISEDMDAQYLPTLVFILAALLSAATGTSWGTMTILFPLVSPAAWKICEPLDNGVFIYTSTISQILSGSIFGDHSSPLSDTTLLSSVASGCNLFRHVWTQMPYALFVAFFAIVCGTVMVGDGINPGVCIFIGIIVQTLCTWIVAAPVISKSGRYDVFTELYLVCMRKCGKDKSESELIKLKKKTMAFVGNGEKEDRDFMVEFLKLIRLDGLFAKCGINLDDGYGVTGTKSNLDNNNDVKMTHIPNKSAGENEKFVGNDGDDNDDNHDDGDDGGDGNEDDDADEKKQENSIET